MTTTITATGEQRLVAAYQEFGGAILRYFLRRTESPEDAADLLAQTYVVAWRRIDQLPDGEQARPWLFGVAHNLLQNHRRGLRRQTALAQRLAEQPAQLLPPTAVEHDPRHHALLSAIEELSVQDRELLLLTVWDGLTTEEAAQALGIRAPTARSRLSRTRQRLRVKLSSDRQ